jgi:hypothetical protein
VTTAIIASWYCDTCGDDAGPEGLLIFRKSRLGGVHYRDFRIVHKGECDLGAPSGFLSSIQLDAVQGDGQAMILSWLSPGPLKGGNSLLITTEDMNEFVDLFRRLYVPLYEEGRRHFTDPEIRSRLSDASESYLYRPGVLGAMVNGTLGNATETSPADVPPAVDDPNKPLAYSND